MFLISSGISKKKEEKTNSNFDTKVFGISVGIGKSETQIKRFLLI